MLDGLHSSTHVPEDLQTKTEDHRRRSHWQTHHERECAQTKEQQRAMKENAEDFKEMMTKVSSIFGGFKYAPRVWHKKYERLLMLSAAVQNILL